jgi:hypothetical protein
MLTKLLRKLNPPIIPGRRESIAFIISSTLAVACARSIPRPNIIYAPDYPATFARFPYMTLEEKTNNLNALYSSLGNSTNKKVHPGPLSDLANELSLLPDLQKPKENTIDALYKLCTMYQKEPAHIDHLFDNMISVGLPKKRAYCSPLQAYLWILEKDQDYRSDFNLNRLLDIAWPKKTGRILMVDGKKVTLGSDWKPISDVKDARWTDFDIVVDRLNDPRLIHHHVANNYHYIPDRVGGKGSFFDRGIGNCYDASMFVKHCLDNGGYDTFVRFVSWGRTSLQGHIVAGISLPNSRYQVIASFSEGGIYSSPILRGTDELDNFSSLGNRVIDSGWL